MKTLSPLKATVIDDDAFRLLAIPYAGPIPSKASPRGVDLDGEWFSPRTDIKPDWFPLRLVDWHHGNDQLLGRTILGKATDLTEDDDGWWVTVWLKHGEKRVDLIRKLADKGAQLYGSSESVAGMTQKASTGEILVWPYVRQTLSTAPQNTLSVLRPMKATLDDLTAEGIVPAASFFDDLARYVDDLATRPSGDLTGEPDAKAGRILAARNEARLREAHAELMAQAKSQQAALAKLAEVFDELERYITPVAGSASD